jgi:hypothetical protein
MSDVKFNIPVGSAPNIPNLPPTVSNTSSTTSGVTTGIANISSGGGVAFPITAAPTVSMSGGSLVNVTSSPNLSLGAISSNTVTGTSTVLAGTSATFGAPTTVGGAVSAFGGPTSLPSTTSMFGVPNLSAGLVNAVKLQLPTIPSFTALDQVGVYLGAGPKFLAQKIAAYKSIVPPFVPRVSISPAQIGAAMAIISAVSSGNPSELLKQMLASIQKDLTSQSLGALKGAVDTPGIDNLQNQVSGIAESAQAAAQVEIPSVEMSAGDMNASSMVPSSTAVGSAVTGVSSVVNSTIQPLTNTTPFTSPPTG